MNVCVKCSLKYSFNFKPKFLNISSVNNTLDNKIYCKNFIYFILFLEYFSRKSNFKDCKVYIQKDLKKHQTILRAPNKHKKAQIHLKIEKYYCILSFYYNLDLLNLDKNCLYKIISFINYSFWFFESSLVYLKVKTFYIRVPLKKLCEL